jgi:uncharacterized protein
MNLFELTAPQLAKTLRTVDRWLKLAEEYAATRKFPVDNLIQARLAPDQFTLVKQVQTACDNAKFIPGRLCAKDWPPHADTETTFEQLHARIAAVLTYVDSFKLEDFAGAEERKISLPWMQGKWMTGTEYVIQFALPNFYFHVTNTYAILRHNGVPLGKIDFIGSVPMRD